MKVGVIGGVCSTYGISEQCKWTTLGNIDILTLQK